MPIQRVKEAIESIKRGEMVVMMDDEDRENEGDLVYAANFTTPEKINFMAKEARGLICVSMEKENARRLELEPMVESNTDHHGTAFTVSVDHIDCKTGISAYERDLTVSRLTDPLSKAGEFARPGHIFPLIAREGGVLARTGHTEGSIDLCKLAGVTPVAVICEVMKEDGTMARRDDLEQFAETHGMKVVYVSDIVEYRLRHESLLSTEDSGEVVFQGSLAKKMVFKDHKSALHTVYIFGEPTDGSLVRFHNVMPDIELLENEKKFHSLLGSIKRLQKENGVLVFINHEKHDESRVREVGIGSQIVRSLGIQNIRLLVSEGGKNYVGISGFGLNIIEEIVVED